MLLVACFCLLCSFSVFFSSMFGDVLAVGLLAVQVAEVNKQRRHSLLLHTLHTHARAKRHLVREGLFILRLWLFVLRQSGAVWLRCGW